jgi:hypothetical protein
MKHTELALNMLVERKEPNGDRFSVAGAVLVGRIDGAAFLQDGNHYYVKVEYIHPVSEKPVTDHWKVSRLVPHAAHVIVSLDERDHLIVPEPALFAES